MKRIKELQTADVKIALLCEAGVGFYIREIGMADNEHDSITKYATREEAEAEYQRLQDLLHDNGIYLMEAFYNNECEVVF